MNFLPLTDAEDKSQIVGMIVLPQCKRVKTLSISRSENNFTLQE